MVLVTMRPRPTRSRQVRQTRSEDHVSGHSDEAEQRARIAILAAHCANAIDLSGARPDGWQGHRLFEQVTVTVVLMHWHARDPGVHTGLPSTDAALPGHFGTLTSPIMILVVLVPLALVRT